MRSSTFVPIITVFTVAFFFGFRADVSLASPVPVQVLLDDLPLNFPVEPILLDGVTMTPLRALSEALGFEVLWKGESQAIACRKDNLTIDMQVGSAVVKVNGVKSVLPAPAQIVGDSTLVPLRFFSECLNYEVSWIQDTKTAHVKSPKPSMEIWGFYALGSKAYSSWEDLFSDKYPYVNDECLARYMTGSFLGWFGVSDEGEVLEHGHGSGFEKPDGWQAVKMQMDLCGLKNVAMVFCENQNRSLSDLLSDKNKRDRLASEIATKTSEFGGILIDFEGLGRSFQEAETDAKNFSLFMEVLKSKSKDRFLAVALPPSNGHFKGYDHGRLGEIADKIVLMAYGYEDPKTPSPTAPWDKVDEAIREELGKVPKEKIILGLPSYGTLYAHRGESWTLLSRPAGKDVPSQKGSSEFKPEFSCNQVFWEEESIEYAMFFETEKSLSARILLANRFGLCGVAFWRLGILPGDFLDSIPQTVELKR